VVAHECQKAMVGMKRNLKQPLEIAETAADPKTKSQALAIAKIVVIKIVVFLIVSKTMYEIISIFDVRRYCYFLVVDITRVLYLEYRM
jgi:hypothetical protein